MKYTVVLTEKRDGNVMVAVPVDVGTEPNSENRHFGAPWEWFGTFKDNPTWGKLFDEIELQRDSGSRYSWKPYCCHAQSKTLHKISPQKSACQLA